MTRYMVLLAASALFGLAAPAEAQRTVERSAAAAADGVVEIENIAGSIRIEGWHQDQVAMTAQLGRNVEDVDFETGDGRTRIRVVYPRRGGNTGGTELTVRVPARSRLKVSGVSAAVRIQGVSGAIDATSVSGDVVVTGQPRSLNAQSVSGSVVLRGGSSTVRAASVSGSVELQGTTGHVEAETTSGNIEIRGETVSSLTAQSVSGNVDFAGTLHSNGSVSVESFSGTVLFAVPSSTRGDFEASSFSGGIRNAFNDAQVVQERRGPGSSLEFSTDARGAQVKLKSFSGNIRLNRL